MIQPEDGIVTYPERVELCEVGPRDGFQFEDRIIPTDLKLEIITALANAGVPRVQAASFVHPTRVPQMADAEEVVASLPGVTGTVFSGLVLNRRGLERALAAGLRAIDVSIATNEEHARDNANMSVDQGLNEALAMVETAYKAGIDVQLGFQTVFGYRAPGDVPLPRVLDMIAHCLHEGLESLSLADSTGMANPVMVRERVQAVRRVAGEIPLALHLHDTRGLGLANVLAALECGVARFDASFGGLGGCPFIPGATGNIATEDLAYMLESMGIRTGVDVAAISAVSRRMEVFLEMRLPGKMARLGQPAVS
jgi:hydroxymethylglutaryl-CoA lyase